MTSEIKQLPLQPPGPRYVAFDVETAKEAPASDDWNEGLGITCAATVTEDGDLRTWHGAVGDDKKFADRMNSCEVIELAAYLLRHESEGRAIVSWNGLGFDFRVLAQECRDPAWAKACAEMALRGTDPAFQMVCERGFMIGLDACAKGLGVGGKTEEMDGVKAVDLWEKGPQQQEKVLEYVIRDAEVTAAVYEGLTKKGHVYWTTRRGTLCRDPWTPQKRDGRLLTVTEGLGLPVPDTSWMDNPWGREKFTGWTEAALAEGPAKTRISLELSDSLIKALEGQATAAGVSMNEWISTVIAYGLTVTDPTLVKDKEAK